MRGDALRRAAVILAQWEDIERAVVHDRHHAVRRDPLGDRGGAAFEDLRHVPDRRRVKALEQRQRGENRGVAAAPGDDDLRAVCTAAWIGSTPIMPTMCNAASMSASVSGFDGG